MPRGGKRKGAGRPPVPEEKKAKNTTIKLYPWEVDKVKQFIKELRKKEVSNSLKFSKNQPF